jgi:hypothetical protein
MSMDDLERLCMALGFVAGFMVLALLWLWLVLVLAGAIAQLWRELVGASRHRATAAQRRPSAVARPSARSPARKTRSRRTPPLPVDRPSPSTESADGPLPPSHQPKCITEPQRPAVDRRAAPPHAATKPSIPESKPATTLAESTEDASETIPLFVIDAPLFQSDSNILDARPADILEVLEDACSTAKAAGYSDEEITRMLTGDAQWAGRRPR